MRGIRLGLDTHLESRIKILLYDHYTRNRRGLERENIDGLIWCNHFQALNAIRRAGESRSIDVTISRDLEIVIIDINIF